jgi:hypothetical protein
MKTKHMIVIALLMLGIAFLSTGCQTLGNRVVNVMYGRSGVFVTNNYAGYRLHVLCSNGQETTINTGDTMQFLTAGFVNGDIMWMKATFLTADGKYAGYDETRFHVYYYNGGTFVRTWDPYLRPLIR